MLLAFSDPELYFFGQVGGWLEKLKLRLTSAKVEVEFGNKTNVNYFDGHHVTWYLEPPHSRLSNRLKELGIQKQGTCF